MFDPFSSIRGVPAYPDCVVPSMVAGSVTSGSGEVGTIECTPDPGMANVIASMPETALAWAMALRQGAGAPESPTLVTTNVAKSSRPFEGLEATVDSFRWTGAGSGSWHEGTAFPWRKSTAWDSWGGMGGSCAN